MLKNIKILLIFSFLLTIGCDKKREININEIKQNFEELGYTFEIRKSSKNSYSLIIENKVKLIDEDSSDITLFRITYNLDNSTEKKKISDFDLFYQNSYRENSYSYEISQIKYTYDNLETARYITYGNKEDGKEETSCVYYTNEEQEKTNKEICNEESGISQNEIKKILEETEKKMNIELEEIGVTREEFKEWLLVYINSSVDELE